MICLSLGNDPLIEQTLGAADWISIAAARMAAGGTTSPAQLLATMETMADELLAATEARLRRPVAAND